MDGLRHERDNMYQARRASQGLKAAVAASAEVVDLLDKANRAFNKANPPAEAEQAMMSALVQAAEVHRSNKQLLEEKERERLEISRPVWKRQRREWRSALRAAKDAAAGPPVPLALPAPALEQVQGDAPAAQDE